MPKEIGQIAKAHGRERNEIKELAVRVLPAEYYKITKGLMWVTDQGVAALNVSLSTPSEQSRADEPKQEHGLRQKEEKGRLQEVTEKTPEVETPPLAPASHDVPTNDEPKIITALILPGAKNPRFEYARTPDGEKIGVLVPSRLKGRYYGKRMPVEAFSYPDGLKTYRLQCAALQRIA